MLYKDHKECRGKEFTLSDPATQLETFSGQPVSEALTSLSYKGSDVVAEDVPEAHMVQNFFQSTIKTL